MLKYGKFFTCVKQSVPHLYMLSMIHTFLRESDRMRTGEMVIVVIEEEQECLETYFDCMEHDVLLEEGAARPADQV